MCLEFFLALRGFFLRLYWFWVTKGVVFSHAQWTFLARTGATQRQATTKVFQIKSCGGLFLKNKILDFCQLCTVRLWNFKDKIFSEKKIIKESQFRRPFFVKKITYFSNFNFWTTLFSNIMPNFWQTGAPRILKIHWFPPSISNGGQKSCF